jgi:type I restriction enzyme S subunit
MNVLLSIKPKYTELIKSGLKKYEFRRKFSRKTGGGKIFIYSTSPVKKIIGVFDASTIYEDFPPKIWNLFGQYSGLSEDEFFRYFKNCKTAFAIEIKNLVIFDKPHDPSKYFLEFTPPQSYRYFNPRQEYLPFENKLRTFEA